MSGQTISRREFLRVAGGASAALAVPGSLRAAADARKPNIIIIFSDDHGWAEMGCQGCKDVTTPNIDSIAANGVRFTDGYVSAPVCSPSRAGLITGRYGQRFGYYHNAAGGKPKGWGLPVNEKTIAQYMKELGYATGIIGKWHLGDAPKFHPNRRGFDEYFGFIGGMHSYLKNDGAGFNRIQRNGKFVEETEHLTYAFAREAVAFIEKHKSRPFFLYLPFNAVHAPLEPPAKLASELTGIKDPQRRRFALLLKSLDDAVGQVLAKVRSAGLEQDTLIFFVGDNGGPTFHTTSSNLPFKGYKSQVHEGGIRVPFLAQWKGKIAAGKTYSHPVITLDLLPTAVAAGGGKASGNIEGVDLLPYLTGSGAPHGALFWKYGVQQAVRKGDWKLSRHAEHGTRLYNLKDDPSEAKNLAAQNPEKVKELQAAWDEWDRKNKEPMWPGGVDTAAWALEGWK